MHDLGSATRDTWSINFPASCQPHGVDELGEVSGGDFSQLWDLVSPEEVKVICHDNYDQEVMKRSWILKNLLMFLYS